MTAPRRVAVCGTGPWARAHLGVWSRLPGVELSAIVAHTNLAAAQQSAQRYGAERVSQSVADAVGDGIDILDVATDPRFRLEAVSAAVAAGVPVVNLEKPYALTRDDADEMARLAQRSGCRIVVNHQKPFLPAFAAAESSVRAGQLGPIRFIRATCQGSPTDQGTHLVDLVLRLLVRSGNGPLTRARVTAAVVGGMAEPGNLPTTGLVADLEAGSVRALLTMGPAGWTVLPDGVPLQQFGLEVLGEDGWLEAGMCTRYRRITFSTGATDEFPTSWEAHFRDAQTSHCELLLRMLDDPELRHPSSLDRARTGLDVLLAAQDSAASQAPVDVPLDPMTWPLTGPGERRPEYA